MSKIILPIKKKYADDLFNGSKTFELRRKRPKKDIAIIFVYETSPTSKIVGKLFVSNIVELEIEKLWKVTMAKNSLSKDEFYIYFQGQKNGYAFEIKKAKRYKKPIQIEKYNLKHAPQGFVYVR